ncbi:hypothetical protein [Levilactobacillus cerevisiae]|uniref:hypothetical protein n=1 Tax=Levilactobacillus cerevisiae TaxID=1704076 RepID=UPI001CDBF223|nr:hypothetical protein [Levilactobacillus cerevisiae]
MVKNCDPDTINSVLKRIKQRRSQWRLSPRRKNLLMLSRLGIKHSLVFDIINQQLTWYNYISGPESDNHEPPFPGDIWVFGIVIQGYECYLKFQDKPNGIVMWISIHLAEHKLIFPYTKN